MRFVTTLIILSLACKTYAYSDSRVESIVDDVTAADYDSAIETATELRNEGEENLIKEAIDALYENSERNLFDFGYRLKNEYPGSLIYSDTFPAIIQRILYGERVRFTNRQYPRSLKLGNRADGDGDRIAYGDNTDEKLARITWRFNSIFENNILTYNIVNLKYNQKLKLGFKADSNGDHICYGGPEPEGLRNVWYLVPKRYNGNDLYYIVNNYYDQALKLDSVKDNVGDRIAYGNNGTYRDNPARLTWNIREY